VTGLVEAFALHSKNWFRFFYHLPVFAFTIYKQKEE